MSEPALQHGTAPGYTPQPSTAPVMLDVDVVIMHTGVVHIRVAGEMDGYQCPQLGNRVSPYLRPGARLVVDLLAVDFLGAAGIGLLLEIHRIAEDLGVHWSVVAASRSVLRPLEVTDTAASLPLVPTLAEALSRVGPVVSP